MLAGKHCVYRRSWWSSASATGGRCQCQRSQFTFCHSTSSCGSWWVHCLPDARCNSWHHRSSYHRPVVSHSSMKWLVVWQVELWTLLLLLLQIKITRLCNFQLILRGCHGVWLCCTSPIVVHVASVHGSFLLWRHCDILYASGFVSVFHFLHSGLYCAYVYS